MERYPPTILLKAESTEEMRGWIGVEKVLLVLVLVLSSKTIIPDSVGALSPLQQISDILSFGGLGLRQTAGR